jgi:hypothetical protein
MSEGKLRKKAQEADRWIRKYVSWWPTYKQTKKAAKKIRSINPDFSAGKTIGESVKRIGEGPRGLLKK